MLRQAALVGVMCLAAAAPAAAQLFQLAPASTVISEGCVTNDDVAYDPIHQTYLLIGDVTTNADFACRGGQTSLVGVFSGADGNAAAAPFVVDAPSVRGGVRIVFSADLSDGAGGFGAFLVVWRGLDASGQAATNAQVVAYPGRVVGEKATIALAAAEQVAVAYSPTAKRFLVAWAFAGNGFVAGSPHFLSEFVMVGLDLRPIGPPTTLGSRAPDPGWLCFSDFWLNTVDVAWNVRSGEFGILYTQGNALPNTSLMLARVASDGRVVGRTTLAPQNACITRAKALSVNTTTGAYVAVASVSDLTSFHYEASELTASGELLGINVILAAEELTPFQLVDLEFSAVSGTFLLVAWSGPPAFDTLYALELSAHATAVTSSVSVQSIGRWHAPRIASRQNAADWVVSLAGFGGIGFEAPPFDSESGVAMLAFGTSTVDAGCVGPDPFQFFGGGSCFNGGWLPPGMTPPSPGGCTTPDPFVAMGGGTCFYGGWLPPTMPLPSPPAASPTTPAPSVGCSSPDPFTAMGGGVCVNGGWVPHNHPLASGSGTD